MPTVVVFAIAMWRNLSHPVLANIALFWPLYLPISLFYD